MRNYVEWDIIAAMEKKEARFIPFSAINEFLLTDYRQKIIQNVLASLDQLSEQRRVNINRMVKRFVQVPGFRNSVLAPAPVKARAAVATFERSSDFTANILAGWLELKTSLAKNAYNLLTSRGWEVLPLDADRTKLPGFLTRWPKSETFEVLDEAYTKMFPEDKEHEYDINMMISWLWGRLPVELVDATPKDIDLVEAK